MLAEGAGAGFSMTTVVAGSPPGPGEAGPVVGLGLGWLVEVYLAESGGNSSEGM